MDIQMNMAGDESPLSLKADSLLSLCELIVGGKDGLQPVEKTVIDRCVRLVYRELGLGLETAKTPILQDRYDLLCQQPEPEARRIATALELYCTGSLNILKKKISALRAEIDKDKKSQMNAASFLRLVRKYTDI